MIDIRDYGIRTTVPLQYGEALERTRQALQEQGFGVLSETDIKAKLQEKLGGATRDYVILGACNPPLAYKALRSEPEIGLLLPCNVIVYDAGNGNTNVMAVDPGVMLSVVGDDPVVAEVARDARQRLEAAIRAIG